MTEFASCLLRIICVASNLIAQINFYLWLEMSKFMISRIRTLEVTLKLSGIWYHPLVNRFLPITITQNVVETEHKIFQKNNIAYMLTQSKTPYNRYQKKTWVLCLSSHQADLFCHLIQVVRLLLVLLVNLVKWKLEFNNKTKIEIILIAFVC